MKFLLPILALSSLASAQKEARFVRIELPGKGRTLTLAEVEVIAGGKKYRPLRKSQSIDNFEQCWCRARHRR